MSSKTKPTKGTSITLLPEEKTLADEIREQLGRLEQAIRDDTFKPKDIDELGDKASKLHQLLKRRGCEPKHHKYMLANREVPVSDPEFYRHVHPVQDLLKFLENERANDDPVDSTIGEEFLLKVHSRRWGHEDSYRLRRTKTGWQVHHISLETNVAPDGRKGRAGGSGLYAILDHDSINYPEALPIYLEHVWNEAATRGLSKAEVQKALDSLSKWISTCEKASPGGIFESLK